MTGGSPEARPAAGQPSGAGTDTEPRPGAPPNDTGSPWVHHLAPREGETPPAGPLSDLTVGVKDLIAVAGLPLGAGTRARAGTPPEARDAEVVRHLRAAGAAVVGTLALHELAFGVTGVNDQVGFPRNPVDDRRVPGGSSSGAAVAVATGQCHLAVGTDTGGSVRIPAALCGVTGFKPARDRYPGDGVLPLSPTLDHVGLVAAGPEPIVAAHRALTGDRVGPGRPPGRHGPGGPPARLGIDRAALEAATPEVGAAVDGALQTLAGRGCELVDVAWPHPDRVREVSTTIMFAEAARAHRDLLDQLEGSPGLLGADVADRLRKGAAVDDSTHRAALAAAGGIEAEVRATLDGVDAVIGPTVPLVAPTVEDARSDKTLAASLVTCTRLANLAGVPALSLPVPATGPGGAPGLPVGVQLVGASDAEVLELGRALHGWFSPGTPGAR